jgi:hypothetical protein
MRGSRHVTYLQYVMGRVTNGKRTIQCLARDPFHTREPMLDVA